MVSGTCVVIRYPDTVEPQKPIILELWNQWKDHLCAQIRSQTKLIEMSSNRMRAG